MITVTKTQAPRFYFLRVYSLSGHFTKDGYSWVNGHVRYIVKNGKIFYLAHKDV